jgi:hypothetical protein
MLLSHYHNAGQYRDIKIQVANVSFENVSQIKSKFDSGGN